MKKIILSILLVMMLLCGTVTVFAGADEEAVVTPRGWVTFAVVCKRWDYSGHMPQTPPYASDYIESLYPMKGGIPCIAC